jgi:hypothetical protein
MKRNLLITLGCSMTEGYGCYNKNYDIHDSFLHLDEFHKSGWPNKLCSKLKFDKCINFGKAGTGISFQTSLFSENIDYILNEYNDWNVYVIFQLPAVNRYSFYRNGKLTQMGDKVTSDKYANSFLEFHLTSENAYFDALLFQKVYIEYFIRLCEVNNFNYFLFSFDMHDYTIFKKIILNSSNFIKLANFDFFNDIAHCGHPNEVGYEKISNTLHEKISKIWNFGISDNFVWEYLGNKRIDYNKLLDVL